MPRQLTDHPEVNVFEIKKENVLTQTQIGVYFGWDLPLWVDHQELFLLSSVPGRWDGASDITVHVDVALGGVEDVGDKFQLCLAWEHTPASEPIPITSNDVDVETTVLTGRAVQHDLYEVVFTIDYDIDGGGNEIQPHELIGMRLRRIAATVDEVDNDIIILDWHAHWPTDKMFANETY